FISSSSREILRPTAGVRMMVSKLTRSPFQYFSAAGKTCNEQIVQLCYNRRANPPRVSKRHLQQPNSTKEESMVSIGALWLTILLSAVIVFVASSILHMMLPYPRSDYRRLPDEDRVLDALRPAALTPGRLHPFPY